MVYSCVGGHGIMVFKNAEFDPSIRKYRGGELVGEIPYAGFMLSAKTTRVDAGTVEVAGMEIPAIAQGFTGVDELPEGDDLYIVSAMYVAACKQLGRDTSRLLTIADTVVDAYGRPVGCCGLQRN